MSDNGRNLTHRISPTDGCCDACGSIGDHCPNEPPAAPSSPAARARGCTCPGGNTPEGNGLDSSGLNIGDLGTVYAIAVNCPVHAKNLPATTDADDQEPTP